MADSELNLPPSSLNQVIKEIPPNMSTGQYEGGMFSAEAPSYLMTLTMTT